MQSDGDARLHQGPNYNRHPNRFNSFNSREPNPYDRYGPRPTVSHQCRPTPLPRLTSVSLLRRRNRFDGEPEAKKARPAPHRDNPGFERYPKSFEPVRRSEPPHPPPHPPRGDLRDMDRRDRDERRPVPMHQRPMGVRATIPNIPDNRSPRDGGHGWKSDGGGGGGASNKGDMR